MRAQRGFTLIELMLVMSIMAILLGFVSISLMHSQQNASSTATEGMLVADLRQQQLKSMIGDTEGRVSADQYGIHFDQTKYTLFHGSYLDDPPSYFSINLPGTINFNAGSRQEIIFEKINGEVYQFSSGSDQIILQDTASGSIKTIKFNKYGVVTQVN
jgi:prepilin-type N-terminal cleavage/methylation domain-containing protein